MNKFIICSIFLLLSNSLFSQQESRWSIQHDKSIKWDVKKNDSHIDNVEMSGFYMSAIVHYGVEMGQLKQKTHLVFPMLRTIPNDTHGSLAHEIDKGDLPSIKVNKKIIIEYPYSFHHKGMLTYESKTTEGVEIKHQLFPSTDQPVFIDRIKIVNTSNKTVTVELPKIEYSHTTDAEKGVIGSYIIKVISSKEGSFNLEVNETLEYALIYSARSINTQETYVAADYEFEKRNKLVDETYTDLVFESPDEVLNTAFNFAKLRAVESIFKTKGGLMHAPGGGRYYAAIWANDQAEYVNPFFPFLGNMAGNESAINSFRHFARFMNDDYKPIPSSIVAEGLDFWGGAGDRGDMAMIAYGATRFALAYGDMKTAKEIWPLIEWCLEFSRRKVTVDGVVASDSDELEGRFPAGDANLNTSCLYYDALISAAFLGKELNIDQKQLDVYKTQSIQLKKAIEKYFGANMSGYKTYRYFKENKLLRAWIATPLTVNIFERSTETINALFSNMLWTDDGLASEVGNATFWDRATLYAFRGAFAAGETKRTMNYLKDYSERRLLGEHVPYPVEAYPEGNQRHLSAESALYCRVITEGLFGIRPTGFSEFSFAPKLPDGWDTMALRNIKAFNHTFDIEVKRDENKLLVKVFNGDDVFMEKKIDDGEKLICDLTSYNLVSLSTKGEGQWWVDRFKSILDEKKQKPNSDLILIGNSIFNSLSEKQHDRKDVWGKYLDKYNTINMGISGDRTENVIWRIENGMLDGINPKVAMVLIGTNNTDGNHYMSINSPEELSQGIIKICDLIHEKLPNTQIILMGILPYGYNPNLRDEINKSTNGILKNYFLSDNRESPVYYVDLRNHFVDHKGNAKHDLLYDYLHPNLKGHLLMFNLLNTYLLDKIGY